MTGHSMTSSHIVPAEINIYFNFRSPYCYLASKKLFSIFEEYHAKLIWKPFSGWSGRSAPERAKIKIPMVRQDVNRQARAMGIPFTPPPIDTDPTLAGAISLIAEQEGLLEPFVLEVMRKEWAEGRNIGDIDVLIEVGEEIGLGRGVIKRGAQNQALFNQMNVNWEEAQLKGVFGVPTFVVNDQIFWGNDRINSLREHLHELRLLKL